MEGPPPGVDLSETQVPLILGINLTTWLLALIAIALRLLARRLTKQKIWWDDLLVIISFISASVFVFTFIGWVIPKGLGRHIWVADADILVPLYKTLFVSEVTYTVAIACVKFSVLAFYWRIFEVGKIRLPIYILTAVVACWGIAVFLVTVLQCFPLYAFWDRVVNPSLANSCPVNVNKFYAANAIPNILTDVLLIGLPLPFIWNLQLRVAQKVALTNIFLLGFFIVGISIARLVLLLQLNVNSPDITWDLGPNEIMSTVEMNIAVVCACLPSLRPLLIFATTGTLDRTSGNVTADHPRKESHNKSWFERRRRLHPTRAEDLDTHPFSRMDETETNSNAPASSSRVEEQVRTFPMDELRPKREDSVATVGQDSVATTLGTGDDHVKRTLTAEQKLCIIP